MNKDSNFIEEEFNNFLPFLKSTYPNKRLNESAIQKELSSIYEMVKLDQNVVISLFDHRKAYNFYLSDNTEIINGYDRDTLIKWGSLFFFRALHYTHFSFPFTSMKLAIKFNKQLVLEERKKLRFYGSGLKFVHKNKEIRRIFIKIRPLILDEQGLNDISLIFIEDISHLTKGKHYWMRMECNDKTITHIHQKGKKVFKELLSERECEILKLIANKKTTPEISELLSLSKTTVETHRKNMLKKTGTIDATALIHLCKKANVM